VYRSLALAALRQLPRKNLRAMEKALRSDRN